MKVVKKQKELPKRQVNKLKKSFDHKGNYSQCKAAKKCDFSQPMVTKFLQKLQSTSQKKMKISDRTEHQK